jgi:hypothetical protein
LFQWALWLPRLCIRYDDELSILRADLDARHFQASSLRTAQGPLEIGLSERCDALGHPRAALNWGFLGGCLHHILPPPLPFCARPDTFFVASKAREFVIRGIGIVLMVPPSVAVDHSRASTMLTRAPRPNGNATSQQ